MVEDLIAHEGSLHLYPAKLNESTGICFLYSCTKEPFKKELECAAYNACL